jgi:hypothetical protein
MFSGSPPLSLSNQPATSRCERRESFMRRPRSSGRSGPDERSEPANAGDPGALEKKIQSFQRTASGALSRALDEQKILREALMGRPKANGRKKTLG